MGDNVFLNDKGQPFSDPRKRINAIKEAAGLPSDFRPMHGLRHVYASLLASSGQVDIYTASEAADAQKYCHDSALCAYHGWGTKKCVSGNCGHTGRGKEERGVVSFQKNNTRHELPFK